MNKRADGVANEKTDTRIDSGMDEPMIDLDDPLADMLPDFETSKQENPHGFSLMCARERMEKREKGGLGIAGRQMTVRWEAGDQDGKLAVPQPPYRRPLEQKKTTKQMNNRSNGP